MKIITSTIRLPEGMYEEAKKKGRSIGQPFSSYVRSLIAYDLSENKKFASLRNQSDSSQVSRKA